MIDRLLKSCATHVRVSRIMGIAGSLWLLAAACGGKPDGTASQEHGGDVATTASHGYAACVLIPKAEMEKITGASFKAATEMNDPSVPDRSQCVYGDSAIPYPSVRTEVDWNEPAGAGLAGEKLAAKLETQMTGIPANALPPGLRSGPVVGIGDEATNSGGLLTARKGTVRVSVQSFLVSPLEMATDSMAASAQFEKSKMIARTLIAKL